MTTRVDPLLAELISSLRELPKDERERMMLNERRRIVSSNRGESYIKYSNILKSIYMGMLSYKISEVDFLNACESDVPRIKTVGYLGLMMMESSEYVIMTINTIMKDLNRKETRNDALTAICNLRDDNLVLSNLMKYICQNGVGDPFHKKTLVAFFRLNPGAKISVVSQDPSEVYVKVQIILDSFIKTGEINLTENDTLFLISLFMKSDNLFLRIKLLQIFELLHSRDNLNPDTNLLDAIEAVIIPSKDKIKPQIEIALSIQAVEFLLKLNRNSTRVEGFVFRLIESQNPNSRYFGLKLSRKYKVHRDIAIDRCIKTGLHDNECLKTLTSFISKSNYKSIYKRKEEIVFHMEKENVGRKIINTTIVTLFSKIVQYARDDFLIKMYQDTPEICLMTPFDRNIPKDYVLKLFNKICVTVNSRYFPLMYQLLQPGMRNGEFYSTIFEKHLNILVIEGSKTKEFDTLMRLLDCMLCFGVPERSRDILVSKYKEISIEEDQPEILDMILNTVYLLNTKLKDQIDLEI